MSKRGRRQAAWVVAALVCLTAVGCSSDSGVGTSPGSESGTSAETSGTGSAKDSGTDHGDTDSSTSSTPGRTPSKGTSSGSAARGQSRQVRVLKTLPGTADGSCVSVAGKRDVRSGGMGAGAFDEAEASFRSQQRSGQPATVRLYFIPATGGQRLPGLVLSVRNTRTKQEATVRQKTTSDADAWTFYDAQVPIPAAGEYEIRATSGEDAGCFRVAFR